MQYSDTLVMTVMHIITVANGIWIDVIIYYKSSPYFSIAAELCVKYCHNRQLIRKFLAYKREQLKANSEKLGRIFHNEIFLQ